MTQETFITMRLICCKCEEPTIVHALTWAAMPDIEAFVGPCCWKYKGTLDFEEDTQWHKR